MVFPPLCLAFRPHGSRALTPRSRFVRRVGGRSYYPMKLPFYKSLSRWAAHLVAAFVWLCTAPEGFAEAEAEVSARGTGTVQGRVYNPATKEYVHDAEVSHRNLRTRPR